MSSTQISSESVSKVLVIGATGYMGRYLVEANVKLGHPTFALVRRARAITAGNHGGGDDKRKFNLIQSFHSAGVHVIFGDVNDGEGLVRAMRKVDVVYSALGHHPCKLLEEQNLIIAAIKQAGNIKRFFPSEFGFDVERNQFLEPLKSVLTKKIKIRETVRKEGIPFTFVSSNFGATAYFLSRLGQVEADGIPAATVSILGDGNPKVVYVDEHDIATYSIKAADDERTLNKIVYIRPPANIYSTNELVSLWETKTNKTLERIYVSEEEVLKKINESPGSLPFFFSIAYAGFIKGQTTNFDIDPSIGVEASSLYPDVECTTVEKYMDRFL